MTKTNKRFAVASVAAMVLAGAVVALPAQAAEGEDASSPVQTRADGSCYSEFEVNWSRKAYLYPATRDVSRDEQVVPKDTSGQYLGSAAVDGWTGIHPEKLKKDPSLQDGWYEESGRPWFRIIPGSVVTLKDAKATITLENATVTPGETWTPEQPGKNATPDTFKHLTVDGLQNPVATSETTIEWELGTLNANTTAVQDEDGNVTLETPEGEGLQGSSATFTFKAVRDSALDNTKEAVTAELVITGTYEATVPCPAPETTPEETPLPAETEEPAPSATETEAPLPTETQSVAPSAAAGKGGKNAGSLAATGAEGLPALFAVAAAAVAGGAAFMLRRRKADA